MFPTKSNLTALCLALGLALVSLPASLLAQAAAAPADKKPVKSQHEKIWWNQPDKIEALSLTQEQRAAMDALLTEFFEQAPTPTDRQANMTAFTAALAKGDWAAADKAAEAMADAASRPIYVISGLMTDVMKLLTPDQRQAFASQFPRIAQRPWVRLQGMAASPGASGRQGG